MTTHLAFDDPGGSGPLVLLLPGAGDLRSEHRLLAPPLAQTGLRVVTADLPGHGDSPPARSYGMPETAAAMLDLIEHLDAGPAVVAGCSFSPAAAIWAADERPDLVRGLVMISPHLDEQRGLAASLQAQAIEALLRGPVAAPLWARLYAGWYKEHPPADLVDEIARLRRMMSDPERRRAARRTLTASREGLAERMDRIRQPSLVVFGTADDHFADPAAEAARIAGRMGSAVVLVEGAGHYPHVEQPEPVASAIGEFVVAVG